MFRKSLILSSELMRFITILSNLHLLLGGLYLVFNFNYHCFIWTYWEID